MFKNILQYVHDYDWYLEENKIYPLLIKTCVLSWLLPCMCMSIRGICQCLDMGLSVLPALLWKHRESSYVCRHTSLQVARRCHQPSRMSLILSCRCKWRYSFARRMLILNWSLMANTTAERNSPAHLCKAARIVWIFRWLKLKYYLGIK